MEGLAVFTALNHSGSFRKNFVKFKKHKYVIYRLRVDPYGKKNCDLGLENAALGQRPRVVFSRPRLQFFTIRTSQPANNIYLFILEDNFSFQVSFFLSDLPFFFFVIQV